MEHSKTSITVTLHDPSNSEGHRFGINALASSSNGELFTGGRDGTVRCWDGLPSSATLQRTLDEHSDWVNDVVVSGDDLVITCSSDQTVMLWGGVRRNHERLGTLSGHAVCRANWFAAELVIPPTSFGAKSKQGKLHAKAARLGRRIQP